MDTLAKLEILAEAARYDVACTSSGSLRTPKAGRLGCASPAGCCHSFTPDGRCVTLLKVLMSNACSYDCAYCVNRRQAPCARATFAPRELAELTVDFYKRNYIEGLFLSSAVIKDPDYTMELLVKIARELRTVHRFGGYIHLKAIPGASARLLYEAGLYADRSSVNIEVPSDRSLRYLAPEKNFASVYSPMNFFAERKLEYKASVSRYTPSFLPAGQSTQMIVGASGESDYQIGTRGHYNIVGQARTVFFVKKVRRSKKGGSLRNRTSDHCSASQALSMFRIL